MDLDYHKDMIICKSLLTTFKANLIIKAVGAVVKIGQSLKPNYNYQD